MSLNLGGWIHSFTVTDTQEHKGGYTIYKITSIVSRFLGEEKLSDTKSHPLLGLPEVGTPSADLPGGVEAIPRCEAAASRAQPAPQESPAAGKVARAHG